MSSIIVGLLLAAIAGIAMFLTFKKVSFALLVAVPIAFLGILIPSITIVNAGHVGVQTLFGEVNMVAYPEGMHLINPLSKVTEVDVRLDKATLENANAGTNDMQQVHTSIVINYRLDPAKAPYILKEYGVDVDTKILGPAANEAFKSVTGHYKSEELITKRDIVSAEILQHLKDKVSPYSIIVANISLVNFAFGADFQKAIEAKVISVQQTAKAQQELIRIKVEAESRIAQAEGEAKAIQIQAAAIEKSGGEQYVRLQAITKWDGKLPTMMNGAIPFVNVK